MVRTRVGYAGGRTQDPTYHNLGGHSETIQIDYDPTQISYDELLDLFWRTHIPTNRPWSTQYAAAVFYHDEAQKQLAEDSRQRWQAELGQEIYTEIRPYSGFYLAEDYHQKYQLHQMPELMAEYQVIYPRIDDLIASTAVARVNGYAAGYGSLETLQSHLDQLGLSPEGEQILLDWVRSWRR